MDALTARVLTRYRVRNAHSVRIEIDRDATLKARAAFPSMGDQIVATFGSGGTLYRVFDGEELARVLQTGLISGGTYSAKAERAHGASWGGDKEALIAWGNRLRGNRYGNDIFLAKIDIAGKTFHHLDPKTSFDPQGPEKQTATMDLSSCNAGLGCSIRVALKDAELFLVDAGGKTEQLSHEQAKEYATKRPATDESLREVHPQLQQGSILGVDVRVLFEKGAWKVVTNDDRVIATNAPTKEDAIELAKMAIRMRPSKPVPMDFAILEQQRRHRKHFEVDEDPNKIRGSFVLKPRDRVLVTKGSRALGVGSREKGVVADVFQVKGDQRVMVKILFNGKPVTLYAVHSNRLSDPEIALMNSQGDRILVQKGS